jgi:Pectate lyase superfamily protein
MDGAANIKEYGARGDGVTDDTEAVEAAIQAVFTNPAGATVPLKRCTTLTLLQVSSTISIPTAALHRSQARQA